MGGKIYRVRAFFYFGRFLLTNRYLFSCRLFPEVNVPMGVKFNYEVFFILPSSYIWLAFTFSHNRETETLLGMGGGVYVHSKN